jgi:CIC family chloride channel protein
MSRPQQPALRHLVTRYREVLLSSAVVGAVTGLVVAAFDKVTASGLADHLLDAPLWVQIFAPVVGLTLAWAALRWVGGGASPATSDEYIIAFHDRTYELGARPAVGRLVAAVATLGLGGALGYEGPSMYAGATIGDRVQRRLPRLFSNADHQLLLVAGAAAGIAAIFKAPATGAVFALEVPYRDDLARRSLLPALVGAATGYLVFVAINGTTPLFAVAGKPALDLRDIGGALVVGLVCGAGARAFAWLLRRAKVLRSRTRPAVHVAVAGLALAGYVVVARVVLGTDGLTLGAGYNAIQWAIDPSRALWLVAALALLRAAASSTTLAGGGVGGLFIPLVVEGSIVGRLLGGIFGVTSNTLFPVLGVAAFLGAGYRVPLAGIMFVAETTGQPGFVVPGLLAAVTAYLIMGNSSVTDYQQASVTPAPTTGPEISQ